MAWNLLGSKVQLSFLKLDGANHKIGKSNHEEYDDETQVQTVSQKQGEQCEYTACNGDGDTHEYTVEAGRIVSGQSVRA